MSNFTEMIQADLDWRFGEIALIKAITVQSSLTDKKRSVSRKYSVPALYAVWEGYIVTLFTEYVNEINSANLRCNELHQDIVTHYIFRTLNLHQPPHNYFKQKELVARIQSKLANPVHLPLSIDTSSNVDYSELMKICLRYSIPINDLDLYESKLNKFVNVRNRIAHGDNAVLVNPEMIDEFSITVIDLMTEMFERVIKYASNKLYICE